MPEKADIKASTSVLSKGNPASKAQKTAVPQSAHSPFDHIVSLQQTLGNQTVQRLYRSGLLQAKLRIGQPNDIYEQEADRVADQVMRMPDNAAGDSQQSALSRASKSVQAKSGCALSKGPSCGEEEPTGKMIMPERIRPSDSDSGQSPAVTPSTESAIRSLTGGGRPLSQLERSFFEPRFGTDFSDVRIHSGNHAGELAQTVQAKAFTLGRDIYFGRGQYNTGEAQSGRLLAHELTHVVQQAGANKSLQRQHVPDTGFRYTPPASVTRSVVEIQGIVGTTPDGVYGENTRIAVEKYQTKLKAVGFYSDTLDGKWGKNTEAAHVAFAIAPNVERRGYNCAGFAFKDYKFHGLAATKTTYSSMTKLPDCSKPCKPFQHKFWLWEFNLQTTDLLTGAKSPVHPDFHTVGGQTDAKGAGPDQVMSKNGQRPVEGPKPPLDWELKSGPAPHPISGSPSPRFHWTVSGTNLTCFCNDKLP